MSGKRGLLQTGQPSKEKYRCPVKKCKSEFRGIFSTEKSNFDTVYNNKYLDNNLDSIAG